MAVAALPATVIHLEDSVTTRFSVPYGFRSAGDLLLERLLSGGRVE
ncbi:hypothetical protein [Sphingomonas sp. S-NIH.Pt15_0812]|jgi:hypothetical protein|nr:hypothetical protein [Sphingomonas sp. S-NIH.Pt15_0812]